MTTYTGAVTLTQYAKMSNDPLIRKVTMSLIEAGNAMRDIPFVTKPTMVVNGSRFTGDLPGVNWVPVNTSPVATSGEPKQFQESAFIIRNKIEVDKVLVQDENRISDPRTTQVTAYLRNVTFDFNDKFINNSHETGNPHAIVGLRTRLAKPTLYGTAAENSIDGAGVDLTQAASTAKTFSAFIEKLEQLLWSVNSVDGDGVVLYLNDTLWRRLTALAGQFSGQGGFSISTDQLGRKITMYKNAVLRDIGRKSDQVTNIITSTETVAGVDGASTHTSIYAVHYGMEYFMGWQFAGLDAKDLGLDTEGVLYRTLIDWTGGLFNENHRSIGRLYGIKLA